MKIEKNDHAADVSWFVGASFGKAGDQTARFIENGIWEVVQPSDNESALVRSMKPGDRIAIKSSYTRKHALPFDNRGHSVSVLAIKAVGTVVDNSQDGERVQVKWDRFFTMREWYFYTYRGTIWRVLPGDWMNNALIAFAFDNKPQDLKRFCEAPYWRERFGSVTPGKPRFAWTRFYEAVADKLLAYRDDRAPLVRALRDISLRVDGFGHLDNDKYADGGTGFVKDICPFTTMGLFNRGLTDANRKMIAAGLAKFLKVEEAVPDTFEGVPLLHNMKSWFFPFEAERESDHIDALWAVFAAAIAFADSDDDAPRAQFARAFDHANGRRLVGWNLTIGLYWIRPRAFLSLDNHSRVYIQHMLRVPIGGHGPYGRCDSADYLALMDALDRSFKEASYPVHSYPALSLEAWLYKAAAAGTQAIAAGNVDDDADDAGQEAVGTIAPIVPYTVDDILEDGCFLPRHEIVLMIQRLLDKKNVILQGAPGTGKTWLAKRLAYALVGQKDHSKVRPVQFHPNLSYEDFVRGWRPTGEGKLSLADGIFMEAIAAAAADPASNVVVVIEEINRGNPAQIFGELLTLLEASKRSPTEALELCYPDANGQRRAIHIPENLYVIGTMNLADRSLALMDLALRRRFAFIGLKPTFGKVWRDWVAGQCNVDATVAEKIERRIADLNKLIASHTSLGEQFQIGHSYVTPSKPIEDGDTPQWFQQVVETEIGPLLDEYWFDAPADAKKARALLTQGW